MRISPAANPISPPPSTGPTSRSSPPTSSFSSALAAAGAKAPTAQSPEFTNMTRQEMFDWMNEQIRSGTMSLDESTPFLGMTMKVSAATGQPVDLATDPERINFVEKARAGIEGARSRQDHDLVRRLQFALTVMSGNLGPEAGVNPRG